MRPQRFLEEVPIDADPVVPMGPLLEVIPESHLVKRMVLNGAEYFIKASNGVECGTNRLTSWMELNKRYSHGLQTLMLVDPHLIGKHH